MNLENKVVMITGAAGNLGHAVATAFAAVGARLALIDLSDAVLQKAYPQADARHFAVAADLMDADSTAQAIRRVVDHYGRLDAVCNIAGGFRMGPAVHETPAETWQLMMNLNAGTLLNVVRACVPHLLAAGAGKIVNIGAGAGQRGQPNMGAYSASKSAVIRLTEAMAAELRDRHININCVLPSIIDTPQNRAAMPDADPSRWVAPADLAAVIVFLCSDAARAIHGAAIPVSGLS
jgi:NAD(P)-dependent dehydrogenase (short-subunit alcohol dehydrogenase family)